MTDASPSKTMAEPSTSKPVTPQQQPPASESQTPSTSNQQENVPKSETVSSFGLHRYHSQVCLNPDKCILLPEMLSKSPSREDGVSAELEKDLRYLGCELIQSASILLKIPQVAAATAQILYQRYFYAKSFVRNDFEVRCLCLFVIVERNTPLSTACRHGVRGIGVENRRGSTSTTRCNQRVSSSETEEQVPNGSEKNVSRGVVAESARNTCVARVLLSAILLRASFEMSAYQTRVSGLNWLELWTYSPV